MTPTGVLFAQRGDFANGTSYVTSIGICGSNLIHDMAGKIRRSIRIGVGQQEIDFGSRAELLIEDLTVLIH